VRASAGVDGARLGTRSGEMGLRRRQAPAFCAALPREHRPDSCLLPALAAAACPQGAGFTSALLQQPWAEPVAPRQAARPPPEPPEPPESAWPPPAAAPPGSPPGALPPLPGAGAPREALEALVAEYASSYGAVREQLEVRLRHEGRRADHYEGAAARLGAELADGRAALEAARGWAMRGEAAGPRSRVGSAGARGGRGQAGACCVGRCYTPLATRPR
jgi:hypothetical protein